MNKGQIMIELTVIDKKIQMVQNSLRAEPGNKEDTEALDKLMTSRKHYQILLEETE